MSDRLESNSLPIKADAIREAMAESDSLGIASIEKALEAGRMLVEAKAECRHGEWLPFLDRAGVPERKAQRLMTLARSGLKSDTVSDLGGIKAALEFVAKRKEGVAAFDLAKASLMAGGCGIVGIERALTIMDEMLLMFPEHQRLSHRPMQLDADPELTAIRIMDVALLQSLAA